MSIENSDSISDAVQSLGMLTDPIDESALREVMWPQLDTRAIRDSIPSSRRVIDPKRVFHKGWVFEPWGS